MELLLSGTHIAVFAAEVMHHHTVGIPGKRTERKRHPNALLLAQSLLTASQQINKHSINKTENKVEYNKQGIKLKSARGIKLCSC